MSLTETRQELGDLLAATDYNVYNAPVEVMIPPYVVLVPGSPYVSLKTTGKRLNAKFSVTLAVKSNDNQGSLIALEEMIETVVDSIPAGIAVGEFSQPRYVQELNILVSDVTFDVTIN